MSKIVEITQASTAYPSLLREIHAPPKTLYGRGNMDLLETACFGVVGTRKITNYGKDATEKIISGLSQYFTIVSGLALGIDALAHKNALEFGGKTIAVLGSGVDDESIYPKSNLALAKEILKKGGLIISEYKPGSNPHQGAFPERNRIISGLSKGVLVIEADIESGSLITAKLALEQNRDVFAVPGSIFAPRSQGTNRLIQTGAKLVTSAQEVLEEYQQNLPLFNNGLKSISTGDPAEQKILVILNSDGETFIDDIVRRSGLDASTVIAKLTMLELKGKVKNCGNNLYRI